MDSIKYFHTDQNLRDGPRFDRFLHMSCQILVVGPQDGQDFCSRYPGQDQEEIIMNILNHLNFRIFQIFKLFIIVFFT